MAIYIIGSAHAAVNWRICSSAYFQQPQQLQQLISTASTAHFQRIKQTSFNHSNNILSTAPTDNSISTVVELQGFPIRLPSNKLIYNARAVNRRHTARELLTKILTKFSEVRGTNSDIGWNDYEIRQPSQSPQTQRFRTPAKTHQTRCALKLHPNEARWFSGNFQTGELLTILVRSRPESEQLSVNWSVCWWEWIWPAYSLWAACPFLGFNTNRFFDFLPLYFFR